MLECAIIGGGPAGLNAALVLGRARRRVMLFDNKKPRNRVTRHSYGFLTRDGVTPSEFRDMAHRDIKKYPSVTIKTAEVLEVKREDDGTFRIMTIEGESHSSKKILIATGLKEELPDVTGIRDYYGTSIFSCPYCDGWELRDQPLALLAGHGTTFHLAQTMYQWSKDIVVCTNGKELLSKEELQVLGRKGIRINELPILHLVGTDGKLERIVFADGTSLERAGGFATTLLTQSNDLAVSLGCKLNKPGGIIVEQLGQTSVQGVYAAGDVSLAGPAQLIIAASQGMHAAIGVNHDLTMEEFEAQE
ncbi:NAD(P)/FAD-dependent oxidoreductase [Ectobacillus sp. JY-23]|uniref:NAD(P)/FAD-dependent oxidoreductase n=1 Tax=Ectobacillus sp. JY-23 TaxID=2933872 RepID=UPI00349FDC4F